MIHSKITELLKEKQIDAILVSDGFNMRYLSGFRGATGYLYFSSCRQAVLTDSRYTIQAQEEAQGFEVLQVSGERNYDQILRELTAEEQIKSIGFEDRHLTYYQVASLQNAVGGREWVPLGEALDRLRIVKTPEEEKLLEKAEAIGDLAFQRILSEIRPGVTELQIAAKLDYFIKEAGASGNSFDTIAASGIHSAMPHAMPTSKKLEAGDFLTLDFGCCYEGYCSDMTRTVVVGKASRRQKEIYYTVLAAQKAALSVIRPGLTGAQVDRAARNVIERAGFGSCFGHGLGHGVGLYIHEEPRLSPSCHEILKEHVIQTVEPGIYLPGFGGVRIEDMVVVTAKGCRNLTHSPKELMEL